MKTNKLGITEGEYSAFTAGVLSSVKVNDKQIAVFQGKNNDENAALFADAGTTANKCGKLPSELLKERDMLLEACREFVRKVECGEAKSKRSYSQMKEIINKIE